MRSLTRRFSHWKRTGSSGGVAERDSDASSRGLRFHASVPIYAGNIPLGVLNVASEDWRELKAEELQLLHIISDQIGLAVQRARLSTEHTYAAARLATIDCSHGCRGCIVDMQERPPAGSAAD